MKKGIALILAALMLCSMAACNTESENAEKNNNLESFETSSAAETTEEFAGTVIQLSDDAITVDGEAISQEENAAVYAANDIVFYLEGQDFTYGEGSQQDEHSQEEADRHTVIHITQAGDYSLSGSLSAGQIAIDLGEDAENDPTAVVNLYLNGVDITCSVAPAVIFYNVYECGSTDTESASETVDTSAAGANVYLVDGTENNIRGSYVARIYESVELSEDGNTIVSSKKLHKYDGAFYSKQTMNMNGNTGILNIQADNEGLDSELHLTINGGIINITSGNDGINTNEDGVSVTTINGGELNIVVDGSTGEGDGIDSNGWLVINGGKITSSACAVSGDAGIDSDMGIYLNGGTVIASGNMLDRLEEGGQTYAVLSFAQAQQGGNTYTLRDAEGNLVLEATPVNNFSYLVVSVPDLAEGTYTLWQGDTQLSYSTTAVGGMMGHMGGQMMKPEEFQKNPDGTITLPDGATVNPDEMPTRGSFNKEDFQKNRIISSLRWMPAP
ncbi:MAG: carbohydrate-binding domain-containing protein [Negativibacillus sp.]